MLRSARRAPSDVLDPAAIDAEIMERAIVQRGERLQGRAIVAVGGDTCRQSRDQSRENHSNHLFFDVVGPLYMGIPVSFVRNRTSIAVCPLCGKCMRNGQDA